MHLIEMWKIISFIVPPRRESSPLRYSSKLRPDLPAPPASLDHLPHHSVVRGCVWQWLSMKARTAIASYFRDNAHLKDRRVVDALVMKGYMELEETTMQVTAITRVACEQPLA